MASENARVLTVDVGNTVTNFGVFALDGGAPTRRGDETGGTELAGSCGLATLERPTVDDIRIQLAHAFTLLPAVDGCGCILSCVVPALTDTWQQALRKVTGARPLVVGPGLKNGVPMRYDDPSEIGPDRVADVVAARAAYGSPAVVVDLGTTTNFEVIDQKGAFAGGIIAPSAALGARALSQAAARLPMIELRAPARVIGRSTSAAMQSGIVLGEVARIDGLLDALIAELGMDTGDELPIVLTGAGAHAVAAMLRHRALVDETLTLRGLALLWLRNRR